MLSTLTNDTLAGGEQLEKCFVRVCRQFSGQRLDALEIYSAKPSRHLSLKTTLLLTPSSDYYMCYETPAGVLFIKHMQHATCCYYFRVLLPPTNKPAAAAAVAGSVFTDYMFVHILHKYEMGAHPCQPIIAHCKGPSWMRFVSHAIVCRRPESRTGASAYNGRTMANSMRMVDGGFRSCCCLCSAIDVFVCVLANVIVWGSSSWPLL